MDTEYLGTTVKVAITKDGIPKVNMDKIEYVVHVWASKTNDANAIMPNENVVVCPKVNAISIDKNSILVEVPTDIIGRGYVICRIVGYIPDNDCATGYRHIVGQCCANIKIV